MLTLVADLETDGLLDVVSKLHQISVKPLGGAVESYNDQPGNPGLQAGIVRLWAADRLVLHNGLGFDLMALEKVTGTQLDWRRVCDTLVLSKLGRPERQGFRPHSLEGWALRLGCPPKIENEDWSKWTPNMEARCNRDCETGELVYERLKGLYEAQPEAVATEHAVAWEIAKMIRRGFRLDEEYAQGLASDLRATLEEINRDLQSIFPPILVPVKAAAPERTLKTVNSRHPLHGLLEPGVPYCPVEVQEFNPGSRPQVAKRLMARYGWEPVQFTPGGAPEVSENTLGGLEYPEASAFVKYLKAERLASFVDGRPKNEYTGGGWLHHARAGRVHASLNPTGTITHRPSCSKPNLQQVPKDKRLRRAFIPTEGRVLVGMDADGIEMRMLGHYLARHDGGAFAKEVVEGDVHTKIMDVVGWRLSDDPAVVKNTCRDNTKSMEYALIYGAGNPKLGLMALENARECGTEINYEAIGARPMRDGSPPSLARVGACTRTALAAGIAGWGELDAGVKDKARKEGRLRGLDGRTLWVRSAHSALNLLLQSAGVIVLKKVIEMMPEALEAAGLEEDLDYGLVMWVHDELQVEVKPCFAKLVGGVLADLVRVAGEELGVRCPLSGSYAIGNSWAETH